MSEKVAASQENNEGVTEDGIEDAFEVGALVLMSFLMNLVYYDSKSISYIHHHLCVLVFLCRSRERSRRL